MPLDNVCRTCAFRLKFTFNKLLVPHYNNSCKLLVSAAKHGAII